MYPLSYVKTEIHIININREERRLGHIVAYTPLPAPPIKYPLLINTTPAIKAIPLQALAKHDLV